MITDKQVETARIASKNFRLETGTKGRYYVQEAETGGFWNTLSTFTRAALAQDDCEQRKMRAALEAAEKAAWMPISEAKSGQTVLAGYRNSSGKWRTVRAELIGKFTCEHTEECGLDPDYSEEADTFYWPEGWYERIESWDDFTHLVMHKNPAHFRPRPKGPSDE